MCMTELTMMCGSADSDLVLTPHISYEGMKLDYASECVTFCIPQIIKDGSVSILQGPLFLQTLNTFTSDQSCAQSIS